MKWLFIIEQSLSTYYKYTPQIILDETWIKHVTENRLLNTQQNCEERATPIRIDESHVVRSYNIFVLQMRIKES